MAKRVLLAGLFHETHTFLEESTPLEAFRELRGDELFSARGDGSPLAGVISVADESGWEVTPVIDLRATPSGTVEDEVFELALVHPHTLLFVFLEAFFVRLRALVIILIRQGLHVWVFGFKPLLSIVIFCFLLQQRSPHGSSSHAS